MSRVKNPSAALLWCHKQGKFQAHRYHHVCSSVDHTNDQPAVQRGDEILPDNTLAWLYDSNLRLATYDHVQIQIKIERILVCPSVLVLMMAKKPKPCHRRLLVLTFILGGAVLHSDVRSPKAGSLKGDNRLTRGTDHGRVNDSHGSHL